MISHFYSGLIENENETRKGRVSGHDDDQSISEDGERHAVICFMFRFIRLFCFFFHSFFFESIPIILQHFRRVSYRCLLLFFV